MDGRLVTAGLFVLSATLGAVAAAGAQDPVRSPEEVELIRLERDWDRAFLANDTAFIDGVLAREFVAVYPDGSKGDRAKELANAAAFNLRIDSSTLDDFTIQVHGDTAVVWFRRSLVGPSKGERLEVTYRYLDVFVRRDGRWQCVASQSLKVPA
jgi:ketosteroid isomerase-like protein